MTEGGGEVNAATAPDAPAEAPPRHGRRSADGCAAGACHGRGWPCRGTIAERIRGAPADEGPAPGALRTTRTACAGAGPTRARSGATWQALGTIGRDARRGGLWRYRSLVLIVLAAAVFATGAHRYLTLEALVEHRERLQAFVAEHRVKALLLYMLVYVTAGDALDPGRGLPDDPRRLPVRLARRRRGRRDLGDHRRDRHLPDRPDLLGDVLLRRAGPRVQRLAEGFRRDAFSYLLFLRFLPIIPFWLTNLASALFGVPLRTFALATLIGDHPRDLRLRGRRLGPRQHHRRRSSEARRRLPRRRAGPIARLRPVLESLITPQIVAAFAALGLLALVP